MKFGVYETLEKIGTKDNRISFRYGSETFMATYTYLRENDFDIQKLDVAEVGQDLIDELKEYFSAYVSKKSVEGFIDKLKKVHLAPFTEEEETAAES